MKLKLTRPIIFFDLETTGTDPLKDRIVEISYLKVAEDESVATFSRKVKPVDSMGRQISSSPEAVAVHKITDEELSGCPTFAELADEIFEAFADSDIAGYNSNKFDLPMLICEFERVGKNFDLLKRNIVDVQNIFYKNEPRTLKAAYRFYCDKDLVDAHQSAADVNATYEVFLAQLEKYEMGHTMKEIADYSRLGSNIDLGGRLSKDKDGDIVFNFGKHKGKKVKKVFREEPSYYNWMMAGDFLKDTKDIITAIYMGNK